jgi:proteasome lid subunit RPN8/RPN11
MFKSMPKPDEMPKKETERPAEPKADERPPWPLGLPISKPGKLSCFLADGLKVVLTQEAFEQLFGYAYATHSEISCLGIVRREGNSFIIERFHLVKQEGGAAHTEMEPSAIAEMVEQLLSQGQAKEARSIKCWAHSHPGMGVFWSKTDDNTCVLLASDYLVSLVVSDDYAIRCRIDTRQPIPFTVDQVPVFCDIRADQAKLDQYAKEVAEKVRASFNLPFSHDALQQQPGVLDDDPWSEHFGRSYSLFDEEETAELEAVREDPQIPF